MPEPEVNVASVAATTEPAATPTADSMDDVLDRLEKEPEAAASPAEEPAKPAEGEAKPSEEEAAAKAAEELALEEEPDLEADVTLPEKAFHTYGKLQVMGEDGKPTPLFKAHPELRGAIGQWEAYKELGKVGELRELREQFPTADDIASTKERVEQMDNFETKWRDDPRGFLGLLQKADAESFRQAAQAFPEALYEFDPQLYTAQAYQMAQGVLTSFRAQAERTGNTELREVLDGLMQQLFGSAAPDQARQPDHRDAEITRLKQRLDEREQNERKSAYDTFVGKGATEFQTKLGEEVGTKLKELYPGANDKQLTRMLAEVVDEIVDAIGKQPTTAQRIQGMVTAAQKGRNGEAERKAFVDFQLAAARKVVLHALRKLAPEWTATYVGIKQAQAKQAVKTAVTTKEVRSAGAPVKPKEEAARPEHPALKKQPTFDEVMKKYDATA